ncbi:MAG TPA: transcription elongation factor GreA [Candidatus Saccharimonadales bacterium]|nr:transcription elongation factor GreA [Candidatus Saccharimonadales bacterium]
MKKSYMITKQGKQELEAELKSLKSHRREIAAKIAEARDFGDLSENAEYDVAREEQGLIETRIAEIEDILLNANIIKNGNKTKIALGNRVELKNGKKHFVYTIVGPVEADPLEGRISNESPIGTAIFGKKVGDKATIETSKVKVAYEIVSID